MPALNESRELMGYKAVTVFQSNSERGLNPHQGVVTLLNFNTGEIKCILEGSTITSLRTAAVSAAATDALSLPDSKILTILGSGRQAYEHIKAISKIRKLEEIRIFNRSIPNAEKLIETVSRETNSKFVISTNLEQSIRDADIVATCTSSSEILFKTSALKKGAHINAIGACRPGYREIEIIPDKNMKIFVDSIESCKIEADEIFQLNISGEIGSVFSGAISGRTSSSQITLFKSVGLAVEDIFAAQLAYQNAIAENISS